MRKVRVGVLTLLCIIVPTCVFASTVYEKVDWISGAEDMVLEFTSDAESYSFVATMTDLSVSPFFGFDFLFFSITTSTDLIDWIVVDPGDQGSISFEVTAGETWFANISGVGGGDMGKGLFGLKIEDVPGAVPIPPAFLLLGSGIAGIVACRKRFQR